MAKRKSKSGARRASPNAVAAEATPATRERASTSSSNSSGDSHGGASVQEDAALKRVTTMRSSLSAALAELEHIRGARGAVSLDAEDALDAEMSRRMIVSMKASVMETMDLGLREVENSVLEKLNTVRDEIENLLSSSKFDTSIKSRQRMRKRRLFSEKSFQERSSLLSRMLKDKDFQTIYNICIAALLWLGVYLVVEERAEVDVSMLMWNFGQTNLVIVTWWAIFLTSFASVWLVQWIHASKVGFKIWVWMYLAIQSIVVGLPLYVALKYSLPPASGFIVMCESMRLLMKVHGYTREKLLHGRGPNQYRTFIPAYAAKAGVRVKHLALPTITIEDTQTEIGRFMYYAFCPSLIYRDAYPRTSAVQWMSVLKHVVNVLGCVAYTFVVFRVFCQPHFQRVVHDATLKTLVSSVFFSMVPSMLLFLFAFFGVLHSWFNMWAELLQFADREFYTDWWNARSFGAYYRKWNIVVHEWLYHYLYLDTIRFTKGKVGKGGATVVVFIVSALFHEWIILGAMQFWYPVLLIMFGGPGVLFMQLQKKSTARFFNIFMWSMLSVGMALNLVLYSREWYARHNPHQDLEFPAQGLLHYVLPQSLPQDWYQHIPLINIAKH